MGGIPEIIESGVQGLLVAPGDIPMLTQSLQTLLNDAPKRQCMGEAAYRAVQPFDLKNYWSEMLNL